MQPKIINLLTIFMYIIRYVNLQAIDAALTISLTNSILQSSSDYTFNLLFVYNNPLVVGTIVRINFPNDYVSNQTTNYICRLTNWPFVVTSNISCSITNRVLTLTGAFTQEFAVDFETNFQFVVQGIVNPIYAGTTSAFFGSIIKPDYSLITPISQKTINISPGTLTVQMSASPSIVSTIADLTVTVTTSHPLPAFARLQFYVSPNTWTRANTISPQSIFLISPSCSSLDNTPTNLYCLTQNSLDQRIITVYNINNNIGSPSSGPVTFKFKISSIRTPPTTEQQGSFTLTILNQNQKSVDSSKNNKLGGISPQQIMNPLINLSNYIVSQLSNVSISIRINTIIQTTDTIYIKFPSLISLINVQRIIAGTTQIPNFNIRNNTVSFSGLSIFTSFPFVMNFFSINNPGYVLDISTSGQVFSIWISRNGYRINQINNPFTYSTISGDINCTGISALSTQAGFVTTYTIALRFQHSITNNYSIQIIFPSDYFNINTSSRIMCSSNLSPACNTQLISNNIIKLTNIIASTDYSSYYNIVLTLYNITNPLPIGIFYNIQISTYNGIGIGYLVDRENNISGFAITSRQISPSRVTITATNNIVYSNTQIAITVNTNNPIRSYTHLLLYIPLQFDISNLYCFSCNYVNTTSTHYLYQFDISTFYNISLPSIITITINNIKNPKSTKPTDTFQIKLFDTTTGYQLQTITTGIQYRLCTVPAILSTSLTRNSSMNSDTYVKYDFNIGISFTYTDPVFIQLTVPNSIICTSCIIISSNSTYYSTIISINSAGAQLNFSTIQLVTITLLFTNHPSFQQLYLTINLLTNDQSYYIARRTSLSVVNTQTNNILVVYSFTPSNQQQLKQTTTLSISSLTVKYSGFYYGLIQFGSQFNVSSAILSSGGNSYDLTIISSNLLNFTKKASASSLTNANTFSISNILAPNFTPNTLYIETYTSNNYKIDKTQTYLTWQTSCTLPCRECWGNSSTTCISCYSDGLLVISKTLFFSNDSSSTCLTECPSLYYLLNQNSTCQVCSSSCANCLSYNICTSCPSYLPYLLTLNSTSSVCYSICPTKYYGSNSTIPYRCLECSLQRKCQTCSNFDTCNSCLPTFYFYLQQCISNCPLLTTVSNQYTWTCQYCPTKCSTCIRDSSVNGSFVIKCLSCSPGYILDNNRCYTGCVSFGLVPNSQTNTCTTCASTCLTCAQSMYNCTSCNVTSIYRYFFRNNCLNSCTNGYYNDTESNLCMPCSAPCQYCNSSSISQCLSCRDGFILYGTVCRNACPTGYYQNGSTCLLCAIECVACISATICISCKQNYTLVAGIQCRLSCPTSYTSVNRICYQCSSNCKTCSLVTFCTSCFPNMYLYQGLCVDPCPLKYYKNTINLTCSSCPYQCSSCTNQYLCTSCISGYQLIVSLVIINATCNSSCLSGYVPIDGICQICTLGCSQCLYTQNNCTSCITGYYSYQSIITINLIYTYTKYCYQTCPLTLYTYRTEFQCLSTCPISTYPNITYSPINTSIILEKSCINCPSTCSTCQSSTVCYTCVSGTSKYNNLCYVSCPSQAPYSVNNICRTCNIVQCFQCSGIQCIQCNTNYLLIATNGVNSCISSCGSDMIYNITAKQCQIIYNNSNNNYNNNSSPGNTTNSTVTNNGIKFVPLPYTIIGIILIMVVLALHWTQYVQIYGSLFGLFGVLLQLSTATTLVLLINYVITEINSSTIVSSRLLASSQIVFGTQISHKVTIMIGTVIIIMILMNIICGIVYCCKVRIKRYRIVAIFSMFLGCKLLGGLLCSGFYGINMKKIQQPKNQQNIKKENSKKQNNLLNQLKQTDQNFQAYYNKGRSIYAKTATRKLYSTRAFNPYEFKETKGKKINNSKQNQVQKQKETKIQQGNNVNQSKINSKNSKSKINSQKQVEDINIFQINSKYLDENKNNSKSSIQNKIKNDDKTNKDIGIIINSKNLQLSKKQQNSQSITSSLYKPSQIHTLPNPKLSIKLNSSTLQKQQYSSHNQAQNMKQIQQIQYKQQVNQNQIKIIPQSMNINLHTYCATTLQISQVLKIKKQYKIFWSFYDYLILVHIPLDIILITAGILLCFNFEYSYYQFYGGIQLVILGTLDIMITGLWRLWNHQTSTYKQSRIKTKSSITNKYSTHKNQQSQTIISALSKQKLYQQVDQSIHNINNLQQQIQKPISQQKDLSVQSYEQQIKQTKTQLNYVQENKQNNIQVDVQKEKEYKSQYARPLDVIELKKQQIEQAINKGIYRQNKKILAQKQYKQDQQSKLDSAEKFNKISKQQNLNINLKSNSNSNSNQVNINKLSNIDNQKNKTQKLTTNKESKMVTQKNQPSIQQQKKQYEQEQQEQEQDHIIDKQINQIIFQNHDQESLATHVDQNDEDASIDKNQNKGKKRKDSLGSQKQVDKVLQLSNIRQQPKKPQDKTKLQLQDFQMTEITKLKIKQDIETKTGKFQTMISKDFTNIFQNQLIQQDDNQQLISELDIQPIQTKKSEDKDKLKQQKISNKWPPLQIFQKSSKRVIYADLDSVGTVSQYDIQDQHKLASDRYKFVQQQNKFTFKQDQQLNQDMTRPSNYINTNFVYHNRKSIDTDLPRKLSINRPKKVSRKNTNINKLIN